MEAVREKKATSNSLLISLCFSLLLEFLFCLLNVCHTPRDHGVHHGCLEEKEEEEEVEEEKQKEEEEEEEVEEKEEEEVEEEKGG